jgi:ribosome assembly protein RRB1
MSNPKKRGNESNVGNAKDKKNSSVDIEEQDEDLDGNDLVFEDPFGDEFEDEEFEEPQIDADDSENEDEDELANRQQQMEEDEPKQKDNAPKQVWRPGVDKLEDGEALEYDPSAYVMYHSLRTEWPCLSFDLLKDNLGDNRQRVSSSSSSSNFQSLSPFFYSFL